MELGEKVRAVREAEGLGRHLFCEKTGINKQTLINIETGKAKKFAALELEKVGIAFPDYALFLLTGKTQEDIEKKLMGNKDYRKYKAPSLVQLVQSAFEAFLKPLYQHQSFLPA